MHTTKILTLCLTFLTLITLQIKAQTITLPRVSQQASISQRVGITDIEINYHSPAVKDRTIWGGLVPFGRVWRAGANENTTIRFTDAVKVEGQELSAGRYGLYMTPNENSVDIMFSKATKNWGTVAPTKDEVVTTITVTPIVSPHQEWLSFDFLDRGGSAVTAVLKWDKWSIPFEVEVDVKNVVINNIRAELHGQAGFGYLGKEQAARYCLNNDTALDEAMTWIDQSINTEKRFSNLSVKAGLLDKAGDQEASKGIMKEAMTMATPVQINVYGYQLLNNGDATAATEIFLNNIKKTPKTHPFYWGFIDSVGEAYLKNKDTKNALKYYKMAKEYAPANQQGYLDGVIKGIMKK